METYSQEGPNPKAAEPGPEIELRTHEDDLQDLFAAITYLQSGGKGSETQLRMAVGEAVPLLQRLLRTLNSRPY
jgi:hypothetical protein